MRTEKQRAAVARKALIVWGYPKDWVDGLSDSEAIRQRDEEWKLEPANTATREGGGNE